jgi:hypothetical protein
VCSAFASKGNVAAVRAAMSRLPGLTRASHATEELLKALLEARAVARRNRMAVQRAARAAGGAGDRPKAGDWAGVGDECLAVLQEARRDGAPVSIASVNILLRGCVGPVRV